MLCTRHWFGMTVLFTALGLCTPGVGVAQSTLEGNEQAGGATQDDGTPLQADNVANWDNYPGDGSQDLEGEDLRFNLNDEDDSLPYFDITFGGQDWENIANIRLLSESALTFISGSDVLFSLEKGAKIETGSGAMWFDEGFTFEAAGDIDFTYGDLDGESLDLEYSTAYIPGSTSTMGPMGAGEGMSFNLILEGAIIANSSGGVAGIEGNLTFGGGGWALLTGGIYADYELGSEFTLNLQGGSSLMLSGTVINEGDDVDADWKFAGSDYILKGGVNLAYDGSFSGREAGHGILQVVGGSNLITLDDPTLDPATLEPDTSQGGGDITLTGYSSLLVGAVKLSDPTISGLGFGDTNDHIEDDPDNAGTGHVYAANMTLGGDSAVIVGSGSSVKSLTTDGGVLTMNDDSAFVVQEGGLANFNTLTLDGGTLTDASGGNDASVGLTFELDSTIGEGGSLISTGEDTRTKFKGELTSEGSILVEDKAKIVVEGDTFLGFNSTTTINGSQSALNLGQAADAQTITFEGDVNVVDGGDLNVGGGTGTLDTISISSTAALLADGNGSAINLVGKLGSVSGVLAAANQGTININRTAGSTDPIEGTTVDLTDATLGGGSYEDDGHASTIRIAIDSDPADPLTSFEAGTLFAGTYDSDTGEYGAGYGTIQFDTGGLNIDMFAGNLIFGLGYDEELPSGSYNTTIGMLGAGRILVGEDTTIELVIGGAEFIPTGTTWNLFENYATDASGDWNAVNLEGFNTVTRSFSAGDAGEVIISTNYLIPAEGGGTVVQQRGAWLNDAVGTVTDNTSPQALLYHELDQLGTTSLYQSALRQLGPESIASGLQVVSDTNAFNAYHEALSDMRTGNELGRPGPARRPLSQSSQSLLASQDEADTIRSQYGYGAGPESGERRQEDDNMVAFVQGYGRSINLDNMSNVIGVDGNQWGVLAGVGGQLSQNSVIGLLVGYDDFNGDLNDNFGSVDVGTVRFGPFFGWANEDWNIDLALTGGYNDWNGTRRNTTLGRDYNWSTNGWQMDFSAGAGYRIPLGGGVNLVPEGSFVYSFIQTDSYTEEGNQPGTLSVSTNDLNAIIGRMGASVEVVSIAGLILEGRLGWQGNYSFGGDIETGVLGFGSPLPGTPDQVDRNNIYYGCQITWMPTWDVSLSFRYEGRSLDGTNDQYFGGGVSFEF